MTMCYICVLFVNTCKLHNLTMTKNWTVKKSLQSSADCLKVLSKGFKV